MKITKILGYVFGIPSALAAVYVLGSVIFGYDIPIGVLLALFGI